MTLSPKLTRREFFQVSAVAGGGFALGLVMPGKLLAQEPAMPVLSPNAFVQISPVGLITIVARGAEIGQGIRTSLPMLIAEELDADWDRVQVQQAKLDEAVYGPQWAGGSMTTPFAFTPMRQVGAAARAVLVQAAANRLKVPVSELTTSKSRVIHAGSGRSLSYGELANDAAKLPAPNPKNLTLKDPKNYVILGKRRSGRDNPAITTGKPLFTIDVKLPGMLHAVFQRPMVFGSKVKSANTDEILKLPGVRYCFVVNGTIQRTAVVPEEPGLASGVAIVADHWYQAQRARRQLKVDWELPANPILSSEEMDKRAHELAAQPPTNMLHSQGNVTQALSGAAKVVEAVYSYPFLAHNTLEPQGATAWFRDGKIEMWSGSQMPGGGRTMVAKALGLQEADVTLHMMRAGGGFGRRLMNESLVEAATIAKQVPAPVKLIWSREDDIVNDCFRPGGTQFLKAGVDGTGSLVAWQHRLVTFGDGNQIAPGADIDASEFPSGRVANFEFANSLQPLWLRTGWLRAPGSNAHAWVVNSFLDELAHAAGIDPLDLQLQVIEREATAGTPAAKLAGTPDWLNGKRLAAVLRKVAEVSDWRNRKVGNGKGMGIACHFCHLGYFAEVAQVAVDDSGAIRVEKVWAVGDVGRQLINPSAAEAQVEGGILEGISHLQQGITFANGQVQQVMLASQQLLKMRQAPKVEIHWILSDNDPTGLGEPSLPPALPAVTNAVFAATGKRIRTLPLAKSGFRLA
jgi:isoquinoline 1-oxidoreductase subunit beta